MIFEFYSGCAGWKYTGPLKIHVPGTCGRVLTRDAGGEVVTRLTAIRLALVTRRDGVTLPDTRAPLLFVSEFTV